MIINQLIRALVEDHTVTITGLGTFYVKKIASQIKNEVVYPPQNSIVFEYSKEVEGFDFVSKLSKWEQIRMDDAQMRISEWIELIENGLEHNKSIFFDDFGTFSKDSSGNIVFQTVINSTLNIEYEGLEPVILPLKKKKNEEQIHEVPIKDKRDILTTKKRKRDQLWFSITISAAAVLLIVLFFKESINPFYKAFFDPTVEVSSKNTESYISNIAGVEEDVADTMESADTEWITKDTLPKKLPVAPEKKQPSLLTTAHPENSEIYIPFLQGKYYVIAGSFAKEADALRHIKDKKLEKYQAKLVVQPQNARVRVCIGVYDNEKDALNFAARIDKNYWVLK